MTRRDLPQPAWDDPDLPKHEPAVEIQGFDKEPGDLLGEQPCPRCGGVGSGCTCEKEVLLELESRLGPNPPPPPLNYDPHPHAIEEAITRSLGEHSPIVERWAKDQAIEAVLTDQKGRHDGGPLDGLIQGYERVKAEVLSGHDSPPFVLGPDDEIVTHAQAILPHIGPEATVAYLMGAIASQMERS